jgi:hypothetical protein
MYDLILESKTLEKLRNLINEETEYRSGPKIIEFFNELGFDDIYAQGFPSRWVFTDAKLNTINGTPNLDKCIKNLFSPIRFIEAPEKLDLHIFEFNKYLAFDKWKVVRSNAEISFQKLGKVEFNVPKEKNEEKGFLNQEFKDLNLSNLQLDHSITSVLEYRVKEIESCFSANAPLSVILLAGSTLEGILLGIAIRNPRLFNCAKSAPKNKEQKIKQFHEWSLANFIDVSKEVNLLHNDVHKFSHALRDFRNYVHPFEQMSTGFNPTMHTAKICLQVLKVAIYQLNENIQSKNA